jgi:hypothetical protein
MGEAIGEGFVDHQSGIASARTRSVYAAIGPPKGTEGGEGDWHNGKSAGARRARLFDQFQYGRSPPALALRRFRIVQRIRRPGDRRQRIAQCLQLQVSDLI